jgi:hypothetical protein
MVCVRIEVKERQDNLIDLRGVVFHGDFSVRLTMKLTCGGGHRKL